MRVFLGQDWLEAAHLHALDACVAIVQAQTHVWMHDGQLRRTIECS
jgi:hypothetical protein